ncbi:MAG: type I pantothenate kinase [Acidimicrobiales bacterium]|nr:type I pantothenate kinase [Acidimicrobiales bacterium]RZV46909.1 MAG: type I pantothenate kinase [Acidimicrobiales bacterium]
MMMIQGRFETFARPRWAELREATPLALTEDDLERIRGINERLDMAEVTDVFLPLSRLLNLHIVAAQQLSIVTDTFLSTPAQPIPFIIGLAGSVAVGKSTAARVLQALLATWPEHPNVALVTTDGFLHPNAELERRGLMDRKGFPESYDTARMVDMLRDVTSGQTVEVPTYSHLRYDVVPGGEIIVDQPDVLIVEGLNVLQANGESSRLFVSDFFDFGIYIDAAETDIRKWYIERFLALQDSVFTRPDSYFHHYAHLSETESIDVAGLIWDSINGPNLHENIAPTRTRADLVMTKSADHAVSEVALRKR